MDGAEKQERTKGGGVIKFHAQNLISPLPPFLKNEGGGDNWF